MYSPEFLKTFKRVIGHEGGYTTNRSDPGNWTGGKVGVGELKGTKYGLAAHTYPDWDIANITVEQAQAEYWKWWQNLRLEELPSAMRYQMFDAAFNHGKKWASRLLQRAVGVVDDGIVGRKTMLAVSYHDTNDLLFLFIAERTEFFTNLKHFKEFGRGWIKRVAQNLRYAAEDN